MACRRDEEVIRRTNTYGPPNPLESTNRPSVHQSSITRLSITTSPTYTASLIHIIGVSMICTLAVHESSLVPSNKKYIIVKYVKMIYVYNV